MATRKKNTLAKATSLDELVGFVNTKFGPGALLRGSAIPDVERMPIGIPAFDMAVGGGIPVGRMISFRGKESSGKTTVALKAAAAFQHAGIDVAVVDQEGSWDPYWAGALGLDSARVLVSRPSSAEEAIDVTAALLKTLGLVILDSIASLVPMAELEASSAEMQVGLQPRLVNKAFRVWGGIRNAAARSGARPPTLIFINQVRANLMSGNSRFPSNSYPGGYGQRYSSSLTIDFSCGNPVVLTEKGDESAEYEDRKEGVIVGQDLSFKVVKNKVAPPHRAGAFRLYTSHHEGRKAGEVDVVVQVVTLALVWGVLVRSGSWFNWAEAPKKGGLSFSGYEALLSALEDAPHFLTLILDQVKTCELAWRTGGVSAPPVFLEE